MEVSGQLHAPAALPPRQEPSGTHLTGGWVGPKSRSGCCGEEKNLAPAGNRTPAVQPVVGRCADYAIPARVNSFIEFSCSKLF
jgi:hypothetical protein